MISQWVCPVPNRCSKSYLVTWLAARFLLLTLPTETDINQATSLSHLSCPLQSQPERAHISDLSYRTFVAVAYIMMSGKRRRHEEGTMFSSISVKQLAVTFPKAYWHWHKRSVCVSEDPALEQTKASAARLRATWVSAGTQTGKYSMVHSETVRVATEASTEETEKSVFIGVCVCVCVTSDVDICVCVLTLIMFAYLCVYCMPLFFM